MRARYLGLRFCLAVFVLLRFYFPAISQDCPPNIDFENGNFDGWECYIGMASESNGENHILLSPAGGPVFNRQTMYSANTGELDQYGGFPVSCPNGSGHSIRLGNNEAGTQAEGISYTFTIPQGKDVYSLIYYYAVVFQDPNHESYQQPRMEIEILDVTDNNVVYCSSFTFIPYGTLLPGFYESPNPMGDTPVWCKDWSAVSVNLDGLAGKTIRLFFKTADCTFRRHFGYAYIDVNSQCGSEFTGSLYCKDDTVVNVTAPYGYQAYTWWNNAFTQVLGHQQTISFSPLPASGSVYAVVLEPYNGYGCIDTLYAKLVDSLKVKAEAGNDALSCNKTPVQLGANSIPGLSYHWSPTAGLSSSTISNPLASPDVTTRYVLTTSHDGGGCASNDTVVVTASIIDDEIRLKGKDMFCADSGDSAVLGVVPTQKIQWYKDTKILAGAVQPTFHVRQSGSYYAILTNKDGCTITTPPENIVIDDPKAPIRYPDVYAIINYPLDLKARQIWDTAIWGPGIWLNNRVSYTPVFKGPTDQLYIIDIKSKSGCETVDTQLVKTIKNADIYVPNAFTPNGNGRNDYLHPLLRGIKHLNYFRVYNRWGQLLFESKEDGKGWDGRVAGVLQNAQVVVWLVEGIGIDNQIYLRKGTTVLVR
jgi:gliding motility-associated-like protein